MVKKSIKDIDITNKRIFLRVDYNIPINDSTIIDDYRIKSTLPTIMYLLNNNVKSIVIGSHLGRPKGTYKKDLSLYVVFEYLKKWFEQQGRILVFRNVYDDDCCNFPFVLLENLRFLVEEEDVLDENICKYMNFFKKIADFCVIDAFGVVHRECGSLIKTGLPAFSGLLIEKEMKVINEILGISRKGKKPIDVLILGGKKIGDKIPLIKKLIMKCDVLFITGGLCVPFIIKQKDEKLCDEICEIKRLAILHKTEIILPIDFVIRKKDILNKFEYKENITFEDTTVDIGPKTLSKFKELLYDTSLVFWNGSPGIFEEKGADIGTKSMIEILSLISKTVKVIIGGGDTACAVIKFGNISDFYHVSTGGGSLITFLEGGLLPGINILEEKNSI